MSSTVCIATETGMSEGSSGARCETLMDDGEHHAADGCEVDNLLP